MKKVIILGAIGMISIVATSCGGGGHGGCEAYQKADYTKYKAKKDVKIKSISILKKK